MPFDVAHAAERLRGCVFNWSPPAGAPFNGTVYYSTPIDTQPFSSGFFSIVIEFTPNFEPTDGLTHFFISDNTGMGIQKGSLAGYNNGIRIVIGTITITIGLAAYQAYWRTNQRNVFVITCRSGSQTTWLNGVEIDTEVDAFTPYNFSSFVVASTSASRFSGYIHSIKLFKHYSASELLTAQEALDYYNRSTFTYQDRATCILPMGNAQHDSVGKRTLDVSGKGNHFRFGDGITPGTFPVKLPTRGYEHLAQDYFLGPALPVAASYTICALVKKKVASLSRILIDCRIGLGVGYILLNDVGFSRSPTSGIQYNNTKVSSSFELNSVQFVAISGFPISVPNGLSLMSGSTGLYTPIGSIFYLSIYPLALTYIQIISEYVKALENSRLT